MNILMIAPQFPDTFWSFKHALKFISKKVTNPPLGLITVAALLPSSWNKKLVDINFQKISVKDLLWADMVFISAMDVQRQSVKDIIKMCKPFQKPIVAGGPLFTGEYDRFPEIDYFVLNEAELTLPEFLKDFKEGKARKIYATEEYANIQFTPVPMWELLELSAYEAMSIQFSRGCPFNCDFCNVTALLGHIPRVKTVSQIIAELDSLYARGWRRNIFFVDDNFIGNKKYIKEEILPALIRWRKGKIGCLFLTEASINMADDPDLLNLMAEAGFTSVFIGIETTDEASLTECHKTQNKNRDLVKNVKKIQNIGIQVMAGFIVGFDTDSSSVFDRQIEFIQDSGIVTSMVGLLQAPYGTKLYERIKSEGRLIDEMSGDNADGTTNIIPLMDSTELKNGYHHIINTIYLPENFYQRIRTFLKAYHPKRFAVHMEFNEWLAFIRSIIILGFWGVERFEYWKLIAWTLTHKPGQLPLAITLAIYGYHFRKISQNQSASRLLTR